jgi:signal transduction histidine kinase
MDKSPVVWMVEDSPLAAGAVERTLAPEFASEIFSEGDALLERLATGESPEVLMLDWELPGMTGLEVCRFIRTTRDEASLPILLMTSRQTEEDLVEGLAAGANDYLTKPFRGPELLARVRTLARIRRLHMQSLQLANEARSRADFERQLIGIVSHDLRGPLGTIILGAQTLIRRDGAEEKNLKALLRIQSAAERGARLVADLLDFTQARLGGGIPLVCKAANLHTIVRQVVEDAVTTSPDREVHLVASGDGHGVWDAERMLQVMQNLIGNALKYSPPASWVNVRSESDEGGITVSVHNTGTPIPDEALTRIFQPMQRATSQLENSTRSVGLGLFIVKHLVEEHGGTLAVVSNAEAGTTFSFRVPKIAGR